MPRRAMPASSNTPSCCTCRPVWMPAIDTPEMVYGPALTVVSIALGLHSEAADGRAKCSADVAVASINHGGAPSTACSDPPLRELETKIGRTDAQEYG